MIQNDLQRPASSLSPFIVRSRLCSRWRSQQRGPWPLGCSVGNHTIVHHNVSALNGDEWGCCIDWMPSFLLVAVYVLPVRARVSLTLRLICGYLLRSLLPFLTCIYET